MTLRIKEVFPGSHIVRKYTFKTVPAWGNYALLARANRILSQNFAASWGKSVHLWAMDCFECLSPHEKAA